MFSRLLDVLRGRPDDHAAASGGERLDADVAVERAPAFPTRAGPTRAGPTHGGPTHGGLVPDGATPRDPVLPHPSTMIEAWRKDVARAALVIRDRLAAPATLAAPRATTPRGPITRGTRERAERLLVRLTFDQAMVVRQPPPAARDALAVAADPECELPRLVRILERDPVLTRGLMRHASSAMFAAAGAPASIDDAVRRLGAKGVQVAVLAGMAEGLLARGRGPYSPFAEQAWARMVRVGPLARARARAAAVPAHEAFLLGLLHDVGALVLFDLVGAIEDESGHALDLPADLAAEALRELHEPLGGLTLLRWGVDPRAAWAVAHHHRRTPPAAPDRRGELLYLATRLDAAMLAREAPPLERWFAEGALTIPRERVTAAVARACAAAT